MTEPRLDLVAIGNAMVDVLAKTDDEFIKAQAVRGMKKGAMNLVTATRSAEIYAEMTNCIEMSGGSAGNTMAGFASFGGSGAYIGKVANDKLGEIFRHDLKTINVQYDTLPLAIGAPTGVCLILVTPDAERTMNTFLGAGLELNEIDIDQELIASAKITYLEGYLFDPPLAKKAFRLAAKTAHEAGRQVALSLSDAFCVDRHRDDFRDLVEHHVDILFANEDEIMSLYQVNSFAQALEIVKEKCAFAALTRSEKGSLIVTGDQVIEIAAAPAANVIDSTGAGDQYAAGFLYGFTQGADLKICGNLGSLAASEVISHMGPRPEMKYSDLLKKAAAA